MTHNKHRTSPGTPLLVALAFAFLPALILPAQLPAPAPAASPRPRPQVEPPPPLPSQPAAPQAPLFTAPPPPPPPAGRIGLTRSQVIRAVLGLAVLFALAYMAGNERVRRWGRRLGLSHLVTEGFPFVLLGYLASLPAVGILSPGVLWELRPLLALALGWIGFVVGFWFDSRLVEWVSHGLTGVALLMSAIPFGLIALACAGVLVYLEPSPLPGAYLRDALLLGTAGAMTSRSAPHINAGDDGARRLAGVVEVEQLAAVFGLMAVAAYFRPQGPAVAWQLPGTAWIFITLGMGAAVGGIAYITLTRAHTGPEFSLLLLGAVAFASGMAGFLRLSPIVVCFIAGIIVVNLPGGPKDQVRDALTRLERPIYFLFLLIAGALWRFSDWQGWVLMVAFVIARLAGKRLGAAICGRRRLGDLFPRQRSQLALAPMGALSIAIVVNAQDLYFGPTVPWLVTCVVGGAVLTEFIVQGPFRRRLGGAAD